ncbi:MAG: Cytochrome c1 heme lyase [Bathelium mastoideum]|nr:MAG: Cytochrome c1 heme lyase [Bathelium mastoideum]
MTNETSESSACPVDHKTREVWLQKAKSQSSPQSTSPLPAVSGQSCDSSRLDQQNPSQSHQRLPLPNHWNSNSSLGTSREVSTIPRAPPSSDPSSFPSLSLSSHGRPANNEADSGADATTGNWVYPSEQMFFAALRRKNHDPQAVDMRSVVPIHNAVNERAWAEIRAWERGWGAEGWAFYLVTIIRKLFMADTLLVPLQVWRPPVGII